MKKVYWGKCHSKFGELYGAKTESGLCYIGTPSETFETLENWVKKHFKEAELIEVQQQLQPYFTQLEKYFSGEEQRLETSFDFYGTDFQKQVWQVLASIPYGETTSYGDIANRLQNPKAVRAVGGAVGANPLLFFIPCHRVIQKDGRIGGFRGGVPLKVRLLELENGSRTLVTSVMS